MSKIRLNVNLDLNDYDKLKVVAQKSGLSVSALIRLLIKNINSGGLIKIDVPKKI